MIRSTGGRVTNIWPAVRDRVAVARARSPDHASSLSVASTAESRARLNCVVAAQERDGVLDLAGKIVPLAIAHVDDETRRRSRSPELGPGPRRVTRPNDPDGPQA